MARSLGNTLRRNAIYSNDGPGIQLAEGGNAALPAPTVQRATETSVSGTACPGCTVEVFSDDADEGRLYEGVTVADATGRFSFEKSRVLSGPHITATTTDSDGNTSAFSLPLPLRRPV